MKRILGLAALCLLLGGICALLRRQQTIAVIPGHELRFDPAHSLSWDPATGLINRTGDDPYGFIVLPPSAVPIREVIIAFGGAAPHGRSNFYIYQYPAFLDGVFLNDSYALLGKIEQGPQGFTIHWRLGDSKVARLDLPDDLAQPCEIRQVTIVSAAFGSWTSVLMWSFLAVGILLPAWSGLRHWVQRFSWLEAVIFTLLIAAKIILASDLHLIAIGSAVHDDALFVTQADALRHGHWLGEFNERTLAKGPVYSMFLAASSLAGAPLQPLQAGVHALACFAFVLALRPLLPRAGARLVLFLVLLFDPHTLSTEAVGRVLRSGIQPALVLFALAGLLGVAARMVESPRRIAGWSILASLMIPLFWFSREEGVWLAPSLLLIGAAALVGVVQTPPAGRGARIALVFLPLAAFFGGTALLRAINARYYGAAITVDVKDGAFPAAYGALLRITPAHWQPTVPVARETQERAFAASPAFAELRPQLVGPVGELWSRISLDADGGDAALGEIRGGWYQWALRDAAARAGHYHNAADANAYWARVAGEINAACNDRQLAAGSPRTGFLPPLDRSLIGPTAKAFVGAFHVAAQFSDFTTQVIKFDNTPEQTALFARITHEKSAIGWAPPTALTKFRIQLSNVYTWFSSAATLVAALSLLVVAGLTWRRRAGVLELTILVALAGGAAALMLVVALVDVTSFSAVHAIYLAPATPLLLALWVLAPAWAGRLWTRPPRGSP